MSDRSTSSATDAPSAPADPAASVDGLSPRGRRSALAIVFITVFIDLLGFAIVLPLLPRYGKSFHATGPELGWLVASFSCMQFLFAPLWGRLSDHVGRRPVMILGLCGSAAFYALFGYITARGDVGPIAGLSPLAWLMVCRIGAGIAGATIPTAQAVIADCTAAGERSRGMALVGMAFGLGFTVGPLIGAAALALGDADDGPSALPGYVASGLSGLALLAAIALLPETLDRSLRQENRHGGLFNLPALRTAIGHRQTAWILLTIFVTTFAFAQFESTLSVLTKSLGLSDRWNLILFAFVGLTLVLVQGGLVRPLLPRLRERRLAIIGTVLMTVGLLAVAWAGSRRSIVELCWVLPVVVAGFAATTPALQGLLSLSTSGSNQGSILGIGQSLSAMARILGPMVALSIQDQRLELPYLLAAGVMFLGLCCVLGVKDVDRVLEPSPAESQPAENPAR